MAFRIPKDFTNKVDRSLHNLHRIKRTTFHPATVIPIYSKKLMPKDKFIMPDIETLVKSQPLISPLYGTFKQRISVFFDSDTNYYGWLDNNTRRSTQDLLNRQRHKIPLDSFISPLSPSSTYQEYLDRDKHYKFAKGGLSDYMGLAPGGVLPTDLQSGFIDAGFMLTYLNIYRNYICNDQENNIPYLAGVSDTAVNGIDYPGFQMRYILLSDLDDFFMWIRNHKDGYNLDPSDLSNDGFNGISDFILSMQYDYGALLLSTYLPDMFVNLLNRNNVGAVKSVVSMTQQSDGSQGFTIDTLRFRNKLQRLIDRYDISGGRFSNWLRTVWGVHTRKDMDIPELIHVSQSIIDPSQITATASTLDSETNEGSTLGQMGGNFDSYNHSKPCVFTASTPGRVMILYELIPMVDYSENIEPDLLDTMFSDDYNPEFAQLGFQDVPRSWYSCYPSFGPMGTYDEKSDYVTESVGKNIAWVKYMTDTNRVHGEFTPFGLFNYWVLQRRYTKFVETEPGNPDSPAYTRRSITQYVDPMDYQYPFYVQRADHPNFDLQMSFDVKIARPIGKRFMPNLE